MSRPLFGGQVTVWVNGRILYREGTQEEADKAAREITEITISPTVEPTPHPVTADERREIERNPAMVTHPALFDKSIPASERLAAHIANPRVTVDEADRYRKEREENLSEEAEIEAQVAWEEQVEKDISRLKRQNLRQQSELQELKDKQLFEPVR